MIFRFNFETYLTRKFPKILLKAVIFFQIFLLTFDACQAFHFSAYNLIKDTRHTKRRVSLFINKSTSGRNNICGINIAKFRKELNISQRELADRLQLAGLDVDKNAVQRMESGQRFITDIEMSYISQVLHRSLEELFFQKEA